MCDADGTNERNLTSSPAAEFHPVFSPTGSHVAFLRREGEGDDETTTLHVIRADGRDAKLLATIEGRPQRPTWSPDAPLIAFVSGEGDEAGLFIVPVSGGRPHRIATGDITWPVWRPRPRRQQ